MKTMSERVAISKELDKKAKEFLNKSDFFKKKGWRIRKDKSQPCFNVVEIINKTGETLKHKTCFCSTDRLYFSVTTEGKFEICYIVGGGNVPAVLKGVIGGNIKLIEELVPYVDPYEWIEPGVNVLLPHGNLKEGVVISTMRQRGNEGIATIELPNGSTKKFIFSSLKEIN